MKGYRALVLLPLLLLCLAWLPMLVLAAEPMRVLVNEHHNDFPNRVTFDLEAEGDEDLTRVTFYYRVGDSPVVTYARPEYEIGRRVRVQFAIRGKQDYLPPGAEVHYQWLVEDSAGHKLKTDPATFVLEDVRFGWKEATAGKLILRWYQGDEEFASALLEAGTQALDRLAQETGVTIERPVKVLIYASQKDLLGALEPKAQEWTGGRSFSELGIVLIAGSPTSSGRAFALRAIPHELSHVVLHQATDNPYGGIPRWLDEGLAMSAEGSQEPVYEAALKRAVQEGKLISLQSLGSNFPADPELAALSYAESYSVVQFIIDEYGRDSMAALLAVFREGSTYDDATQEALGLTINELDAAWKRSLGLVETPTPAVSPIAAGQAAPAAGSSAPSPTPASAPPAGRCAGPLVIIGGAIALAGLLARRP